MKEGSEYDGIHKNSYGEMAALGTAICLLINAITFEAAGKKIGSLSVSYIRLFIAFILLKYKHIYNKRTHIPDRATANAWIWLLISGLFGFVLGDLFLFKHMLK